jgi:hypothetical protein
MEGFSMIKMDAWKCNKCNKVYLNADEAEDCCSFELGEPGELPMFNQAVNKVEQLESRIKALENALKWLL